MEASSTLTDRVMIYPVDILTSGDWDALKQSSEAYLARLRGGDEESTDWFSLTNGEKLAVTPSSVTALHIHKEVPGHWIPALHDLRDKGTVVALYLDGRWWTLENALRTSSSARQGLVQVHSVAEQIVLYLLNWIIYRKREFLPGDVQFLRHPAKQFAKVFWKNGEAMGFYTVREKGSLCTECTSQCYQLPVLDTVFVRRAHQRQGIGLKILQDFCSTFCEDEAVGISRPISGAMYREPKDVVGNDAPSVNAELSQLLPEGEADADLWNPSYCGYLDWERVCSKYLQSRPHEHDRVWQVEAPGDWSQRVNVWLQIQMGDLPSINTPGCGDSSRPSPEGQSSLGSTDTNITRQSPCVRVCDPHCEVILEPSEEVASGSQTWKGESSEELNVTEGKREESRSDTETTTGRKRRITGLSPASNSKQVKLTGSLLSD